MNFLSFRGNRVNIQGVSTAKATRKSVHKFWKNSQFSFLMHFTLMFVQNLMIFFPDSKRKPIHVPIVKKIHHLEHTQYTFLDHSKTLAFSDVIKIEILFKY